MNYRYNPGTYHEIGGVNVYLKRDDGVEFTIRVSYMYTLDILIIQFVPHHTQRSRKMAWYISHVLRVYGYFPSA